MSIEKIIQESINKNPTAMKAALEEELKNRIRLALEASDEDEEDDDEEDEMDEMVDAKKPVTKDDVIKLMVKRGSNPKDAAKMVDKEFDSVTKIYKNATASKILDVIQATYGVDGVER